MNLRSLFQRLMPPKKTGNSVPQVLTRGVATRFSLEITNLEDRPKYVLEDHFTVGSEIGDLVLDHASLSPRHGTFFFKNGVVTFMDHASTQGSFLNGGALPQGRSVILEPGDEILLGEVAIKLLAEERDAPVSQETVTEESHEVEAEEEIIDSPPVPEVVSPRPEALEERLRAVRAKKSAPMVAIGGGVTKSANTLPRVLGLLTDILIAVIIWQIFSPFDEFRFVVEVIPQALQESVWPWIGEWAQGFGFDLQILLAPVFELLSPLEDDLQLSHLAGVWMIVRLASVALFGMSIGNFMVGIRAEGNALWKRAGGLLREGLGFITGPFLVFDLAALFSRRTVKEYLTRTQLYVVSAGSVTISLLVFLPMLLALLVVAPVIAGLELPEQIIIHNRRPVRDRSVETPETVKQVVASNWFGTRFTVDAAKWWVLPRFSWSQAGKKRILTPTLVFHNDAGATVPLVIDKTFDWAKLLGPIFEHNPQAQHAYPTVWRYIQSTRYKTAAAMAFRPTEQDKKQFSAEVQTLVESVFALSPDTMWDHILNHGPFLKGYVEAKKSLLGLVSAKEDSAGWAAATLGDATTLIFETAGSKPVDYLIPLTLGQGRVLRVNYSTSKERSKVGKLAHTEIWSKAEWQMADKVSPVGLVGWIDVLANLASPTPSDAARARVQDVYGAYFEAAAAMVTLPPDATRRMTLSKSLKNSVDVLSQISRLKVANNQSYPAEEFAKLKEKLSELLARLNAGDSAFFGTTP